MIDPRGMRVTDWCNQTALALSSLGPIPTIRDPKEWKLWALVVIAIPAIAAFIPPSPVAYRDSDWGDWATRFIQAVPL